MRMIAMTATKTMWVKHYSLRPAGEIDRNRGCRDRSAGAAYSVCADSLPTSCSIPARPVRDRSKVQTERVILRDYKFAWANLEQAMESNSTAPLSGLFVGHSQRMAHQTVKPVKDETASAPAT